MLRTQGAEVSVDPGLTAEPEPLPPKSARRGSLGDDNDDAASVASATTVGTDGGASVGKRKGKKKRRKKKAGKGSSIGCSVLLRARPGARITTHTHTRAFVGVDDNGKGCCCIARHCRDSPCCLWSWCCPPSAFILPGAKGKGKMSAQDKKEAKAKRKWERQERKRIAKEKSEAFGATHMQRVMRGRLARRWVNPYRERLRVNRLMPHGLRIQTFIRRVACRCTYLRKRALQNESGLLLVLGCVCVLMRVGVWA